MQHKNVKSLYICLPDKDPSLRRHTHKHAKGTANASFNLNCKSKQNKVCITEYYLFHL